MIADVVIPEWLAQVLIGAVVTASMSLSAYLAKKVSGLEKCVLVYETRIDWVRTTTERLCSSVDQLQSEKQHLEHRCEQLDKTVNRMVVQDSPLATKSIENLNLRMQHLEDRLGTSPPFAVQ